MPRVRRRQQHGYNEVTERRGHPVLGFLGKFWGMSAWMLEVIMVLSAVLGEYSDHAAPHTFSFVLLLYVAVFSVVSARERHRLEPISSPLALPDQRRKHT